MSLEGNLKDFSLAEILQLISVQQKSGMLTIMGKENTIFFFRDGNLISVRDRRKKSRDPLQEYIAHTGVLSKEDLLKASRIQVETKIDLAEIMVSEGFLGKDDMSRILHDLIQDTTFNVMQQEDNSSYKFIAGTEILQGIRSPVNIKVDAILMETMRRLDEFPRHREALPDPNVVIARTDKIPEDSEEAVEGRELATWNALDDQHTLSYLLAHLGMPHYEVYENCHLLIEKGLIEIVSRPEVVTHAESGEQDEVEEEGEGKPGVGIRTLLVWSATAFGIFVSLVIGYRSAQVNASSNLGRMLGDRSFYEREGIGENRDVADVDIAIKAFKAQVGSYPSSLEELASRKLVSEDCLSRLLERGWQYQLTSKGKDYTLVRRS